MKEDAVKNHVTSAIITVIGITFMTVYAELNEAFKNFLKGTFYHHWIGKGVLAIILFFIFAHLIKLKTNRDIHRLTNDAILVTLLCSVLIIVFFVWEAFG
ncbi:MAG: hypothetical protein AABW64_01190 [Nanoarchaeota archaeon]